MCTGRLRTRVPSARPMFVAQLTHHIVRFHKRSTDGSAKADAEYTGLGANVVWGVVFEIDAAQKQRLDLAEGLGRGYEEKSISLKDSTGQMYEASMYLAAQAYKDADLRPYSWYLRFVVEGAKQHGLPPDYVGLLERVESIGDQDGARDARERAIVCSQEPEGPAT